MDSLGRKSFGRVPADTVELFDRTVATVRDQVVPGLPTHAGSAVRAFTLEEILAIVLRDWRENDNTTGLIPSDVEDLKSFVALAASLADDINGRGFAVYQAVLKGLLEDWLANWNAEGHPGPPQRD